MKIATITYHRAINYGSALQTYALSKYLRELGNDVETIDFYTQKQHDIYTRYEPINGIMSIARNFHTFMHLKAVKTKEMRFNKFIEKYVPLTEFSGHSYEQLKVLSDDYDMFICGSDQIWNTNCADFDKAYLLEFVSNKEKCYSYAASIGVNSLNDASELLFKNHLSNFQYLSVREKTGSEYLQTIIDKNVETVLDPVFLLDKNKWSKISSKVKIDERFVLGYYIGDIDGMRKFGEQLAKKAGCKVVVINKNLRDVYGNNLTAYSAGPREFLWLIEHAEYICTNSFHALSFSVIFQKKFWVFVDKNINGNERPQSRIFDIADELGLTHRLIDKETCNEISFDEQIDWDSVYSKLNPLIEKSKRYIEKCLNKGESLCNIRATT